MEHRKRFKGIDSASLCSLAGRYENPIPTRFLAPIDCSKIPALIAVLEFLNNLLGQGAEQEWGCHIGPPGRQVMQPGGIDP